MLTDFIYVACEGQSEASFVKHILSPYYQENKDNKSFLQPHIIITSNDKRHGKRYTGGMTTYLKAKNDIIRLIKNNRVVTTMFDYFKLPLDFPGYDESKRFSSDLERVIFIEKQFREDICKSAEVDKNYFRPYIQLHEFEALFYADLDLLGKLYVDSLDDIELLKKEVAGIEPEDINSGEETAPSKRLQRHFNYRKGNRVMNFFDQINMDKLRHRCPHFSDWIERIEE